MKFIISNLSPKMFPINEDFDLRVHHLTEDEFQALAYDGFSCIGHEDIANLTGFAYNKENVNTRIGDVLLLAEMNKGSLRFYCIQVVESNSPLLREEELYAEI
jgi:hypothetical protein